MRRPRAAAGRRTVRAARAGAGAAPARFREGTNVEFAEIEAPDRVRIRIWERGVGPTESSGTGSCAAAVAAIAHAGGARVAGRGRAGRRRSASSGRRMVVFLTGWAELLVGRGPGLQTFNQAIDAVESYSPAEERFNRRRRTVGLWLAPGGAAGAAGAADCRLPVAASPHGRDPGHGRRALGERGAADGGHRHARPDARGHLPGGAGARSALAPFADPIIFLFIGSFMLAEAMFVHGVDRRIAFTALSSRVRRHERRAHPAGLRRRRDRALDVDQQHRDDGDDVSDRAVDRQRT